MAMSPGSRKALMGALSKIDAEAALVGEGSSAAKVAADIARFAADARRSGMGGADAAPYAALLSKVLTGPSAALIIHEMADADVAALEACGLDPLGLVEDGVLASGGPKGPSRGRSDREIADAPEDPSDEDEDEFEAPF